MLAALKGRLKLVLATKAVHPRAIEPEKIVEISNNGSGCGRKRCPRGGSPGPGAGPGSGAEEKLSYRQAACLSLLK